MTPTKAQKAAQEHNDDRKRQKARRDFYRIVKTRLDSRLERHEVYTTTPDLYAGYEKLAREGFDDTPPSQIVAQVLSQKAYRGRLFYARNIITHKAERSGPGRTAPYKVYLRDDATPPRDYVLVPIDTPKDRIAQTVAEKKGSLDATLHVNQRPQTTEPPAVVPQTPVVDYERSVASNEALSRVVRELTEVVTRQAGLIDALTRTLSAQR